MSVSNWLDENYKQVGRFTTLTWEIYHYIGERILPTTVKEVSERFGIPKARARRHMHKLWRIRYLARRRVSFWNGMHYAKRDYYW